jgi:putative addiction module component (TIGR02574 family)
MTTITIKNSGNISRTEFEDLADLQNYLSLRLHEDDYFSPEEEKELDRRYEELKSGKVKGIPWDEVREKFTKRLNS